MFFARAMRSGATPVPYRSRLSVYDLVRPYKNYGVGLKITRGTSHFPETYVLLTRIEMPVEGVRGKAWGVHYWRGAPIWRGKEEKGEVRMRGQLKKEWTVYDDQYDTNVRTRLAEYHEERPSRAERYAETQPVYDRRTG